MIAHSLSTIGMIEESKQQSRINDGYIVILRYLEITSTYLAIAHCKQTNFAQHPSIIYTGPRIIFSKIQTSDISATIQHCCRCFSWSPF